MTATVTSKGQLTIPKKLREKHGLSTGATIHFDSDDNGNLTLKKAPEKTMTLEDLWNVLGPAPIGRPVTLEEIEEGIIRGAIYGEEGDESVCG
jgi:AbrB family looped-hinge helix DNA binding protein